MRRIFDLDGRFMSALSRLTDLVILNILFIICCIPIITIGPAWCSLYSVTLKMARNEDAYIFRSFFKAFKNNFKVSFLTWLIILASGAFLYTDYHISSSLKTGILSVLAYFFIAMLFLLVVVTTYIFPYIAWFENPMRQNFKNALLLSIAGLPYTALMVVIYLACIAFTLFFLEWALLVFILVGFAAVALINSFFFRKLFDKFVTVESSIDDAEQEEAVDIID